MSEMDPMAAIRATFFQECEEQLADLEAGLLTLERGQGDADTINAVFRAVHSIKGGAGAFALEELVRFAHVFESVLEDVRMRRLNPNASVVEVLLRAADVLTDLVRAARDDAELDPSRTQDALARLQALATATGSVGIGAELEGLAFQPIAVDFDFTPVGVELARRPNGFAVTFRPHAGMYAHANEAALLLRELGRLGEMRVALNTSALPHLDDLEAEGAYLAWTATLHTDACEAEVREVFDWVEGECDLSIAPLSASSDGEDSSSETGPGLDIAALLARVQASVDEGGGLAATVCNPVGPGGAQRLAGRDVQTNEQGDATIVASQTIRVDLERVDRLIDLVGELVINNAMLAQRVMQTLPAQSKGHQADTVGSALEGLEHLVHDIQESVMAIRAQPVRAVFQRMPRLVREVAALVGKPTRLITEGEACEVDRTVIERLSDPLVHMIRNAIDHGIESGAERASAGKPVEGVIRLSAAHRSGRVVIEVSDDGRGIDRPRVRAIAEERGIVPPGAALSDEEVDNLIFAPGFSTASVISDISGRGVGMDVVRRQVQSLGGRITIASQPGQGSTFTLSLPLTLAVLDGMVVEAAGQTLVIPLTAVVETLQPKPGQVRALGASATLLAMREEHVPLSDLGCALGFRTRSVEPCEGVALLVEDDTGARHALLADAIHGQRQVVIKSLEANYGRVEGVAAATILGDGRVALIVDVEALTAMQRTRAGTFHQARVA